MISGRNKINYISTANRNKLNEIQNDKLINKKDQGGNNYSSISFLKYVDEPFMIGVNWIVIQPNEKEVEEKSKNSFYHTANPKNCQLCNVEFDYGRSNAYLCNIHHLFVTCAYCGKLFEVNLNSISGTDVKSIIDAIHNNEKIFRTCSKDCKYMIINNSESMKEQARNNCNKMNYREEYRCDSCGNITKHNGYGTCLECHPIYKEEFCDVCQENTNHRNGICLKCNPIGYHEEFCNTCNKIKMHNNSYCCECNPEVNGQYGSNGKINTKENYKRLSNQEKELIKQNRENNIKKNNKSIDFIIKNCNKCNCKTPHNLNNECLVCLGEYIWCEIHNTWETIEKYNNEPLPKKIQYCNCSFCNGETPHKYNQNTRELECLVCTGEYIYNFYKNNFIKIDKFEDFEENNILNNYYKSILIEKGIEIELLDSIKRKARNAGKTFKEYVKSLVWCEHCQQWEEEEYNKRPNHWMFWTEETKLWMDNDPKLVKKMQRIIKGFDILLDSEKICGVYGWFINDYQVYYGESTDILTRSYNHMMHIVEDKEYWYNIIDYLKKNKIEIRILETVDRNLPEYKNMDYHEFKKKVLKPLELYYINRDKPDSQKCDGTDHIRPIKERQLKINM